MESVEKLVEYSVDTIKSNGQNLSDADYRNYLQQVFDEVEMLLDAAPEEEEED